jgi:hypothetical protein
VITLPLAVRECGQLNTLWQGLHPTLPPVVMCNAHQLYEYESATFPPGKPVFVVELLAMVVLLVVLVEAGCRWWAKGRHRVGSGS